MPVIEWDDEFSDDDLREATRQYLPETVVWTTDWTTGSLIDQIQREVFDVEPPFQRRSAWNDRRASLYVESLLLSCPVPAITLAELPQADGASHQYIVIDGKQRLGALKRFAVDRTLILTGLETLEHLNGSGYDAIVSDPNFSRFANLPIRTVVMRNWRKTEVLQFVFHRLNTQVTPLSTHELRRALFAGEFTEYLDRRSARSAGIQRILGISEPDYRLRDAELLLRAIALVCFFDKYRGNLKQFLDTTTNNLNRSWSTALRRQLDAVVDSVEMAIETTFTIFGDDAFQRFEDGNFTHRFNRAVFDVMITTLRHQDINSDALAHRDEVVTAFVNLLADNAAFSSWTQSTTKSQQAVQGRIAAWSAQLGEVLHHPELEAIATASPKLSN